jgi:hypothetical protein
MQEPTNATTNETVDVKSKTEYYNNERILSEWGFADNKCYNCGILNSDLNGLLMQCGKCKKAYYCGIKVRRQTIKTPTLDRSYPKTHHYLILQCFNQHLPEHNKFCGTKEIYSEPKGQNRAPFEFEKEPVLKSEPPVKESNLHSDPVESVEESDSEEEETEEVAELQSSIYSLNLDLPDEPLGQDTLSHSFSEFGRGCPRYLPEREGFVREEVDLRHAELMKREYGWLTPDWIDAQLRPTPHGTALKQKCDIVNPVTNAKVMIEQGIFAWESPIWVNAKLRKTQRGEEIKRGAFLNEEQDFPKEHKPTSGRRNSEY